MPEGSPRPTFYVAVAVVVLALVAFAIWRFGGTPSKAPASAPITSNELNQVAGKAPEAPDTSGITTVKEYNYVPASKLPEVKGISNYKPLADRTIKFAINVWAGWGPIIYANNGFKPGKPWKVP